MTATGPALCGCAFSSDGRPCVAHRVCPIPIWPCSGASASRCAQIFELALGAANFELAAIDDSRDAGRVVAAILEAAEPAEQDWVGLARPDVSDYSAHDRSLLSPQSQGTLQSFPNARRCENDSEINLSGEFRKSRQSRMLCHLRRVLSRGHPRGFLLASIDCGAGKPSAESFDTASTSSTHRAIRDESWRYSHSIFSIASPVTSLR